MNNIATDPVYVDDPNAPGVQRLVAAPGDEIPAEVPTVGVVTPPDPSSVLSEPLSGYDALTEDELVARLPELSADELAAVQAYEQAHLARGSITRYGQRSTVTTSRAAKRSVPAESTSTGYDSMSPEDLQAEAARRELDVQGTGADGNVLKKDLVAALQADDAKADE
jgi:hypothetical protein